MIIKMNGKDVVCLPIKWILMKDKKPRKGQRVIGLWNLGGTESNFAVESVVYYEVYSSNSGLVAWYPLEIPFYVKESVEK